MDDRLLRYINGNEEIKKALPVFKEVFVQFYGEEHREEIEKKFSNLLPIGYITPKDISICVSKLTKEKSEELLKPILDKCGITQEDFIEDFKNKDYMKIEKIYEVLDFYKLSEDGRKQAMYEEGYEFLSSKFGMSREEYEEFQRTKEIPSRYTELPSWEIYNIKSILLDEDSVKRRYDILFKGAESELKKLIPEINRENYDELLNNETIEKLISLREEYEEAYRTFLEYDKNLEPYYQEIEKTEKSKNDLSNEIYKKLLKENLDLLPEDKREEVKEFIEGKKSFYDLKTKDIIGYSLESNSLIESFSKEAEEELNNSETNKWLKESIVTDRINYFKALGLDLGNDYNLYLESEEAKKLAPSMERADKYVESKKEAKNEFNNRFYMSLERFQKILLEIGSIDLIDKDTPINASMYTRETSFASPNLIRTEQGNEIFSLMTIKFDSYDEDKLDHIIVHELNHVIETSLSSLTDDKVSMYCGWEILEGTLSSSRTENVNTLDEREKRPYELFNEIMNEMIAIEISKIMHKEEIYVFDDKSKSKYSGTTSYEYTMFLVRQFFEEYKETILESRRNGNIQVIFDEVGKENFDALNELFHEFNEHFGGMKVYNLLNSISKNEETEQTKIYFDLCARRDKILENMRMHKENNMQETK